MTCDLNPLLPGLSVDDTWIAGIHHNVAYRNLSRITNHPVGGDDLDDFTRFHQFIEHTATVDADHLRAVIDRAYTAHTDRDAIVSYIAEHAHRLDHIDRTLNDDNGLGLITETVTKPDGIIAVLYAQRTPAGSDALRGALEVAFGDFADIAATVSYNEAVNARQAACDTVVHIEAASCGHNADVLATEYTYTVDADSGLYLHIPETLLRCVTPTAVAHWPQTCTTELLSQVATLRQRDPNQFPELADYLEVADRLSKPMPDTTPAAPSATP